MEQDDLNGSPFEPWYPPKLIVLVMLGCIGILTAIIVAKNHWVEASPELWIPRSDPAHLEADKARRQQEPLEQDSEPLDQERRDAELLWFASDGRVAGSWVAYAISRDGRTRCFQVITQDTPRSTNAIEGGLQCVAG